MRISHSKLLLKPIISIFVLAVFSIGIFLIIFQYWMGSLFQQVEIQHRQGLIQIVSVARNAVEPVLVQVRSGKLSREDALRQLRSLVRTMIYNDQYGKNYVFMSSYDGTMLVQPYEPWRELTNQWDLQDAHGLYIIRELVRAAQTHPDGSFVRYNYHLPGAHITQEKLAYIIGLPELSCYIGTGMYMQQAIQQQGDILRKIKYSAILLLFVVLIPASAAMGFVMNRNKRLLAEVEMREKAEEELRRSEAKYRSIFENAMEGIFQSTAEGRFISVNPALASIAGYDSPHEMMENITDISAQVYVDPADRVRHRKLIEDQGYANNYLVQLRRKDGSLIWVSINTRAIKDEKGKLLYYEGSVEDITVPKVAEEALKESESKYRLLAENSADVIFIFSLDMKFTYVSPSVKKVRGYSPDEVIGQPIGSALTNDSAEYVRKLIGEELEIEKSGSSDPQRTRILEVEMLCKDGSTVWMEIKASFMRDNNGNPNGIIGISRDITERRQVQEELLKSEEKFKKAFYTSPDAININRLHDGMYISTNKGFYELTGYTEEDVKGKTSLDINIWNDINDRSRLVEGLKKTGKVDNLEAQFRLKTGEVKYGMMSATLIDLDGTPHILSVTRDITERKRSEEEKARLESQLLQAQKMEAIGTLTGGIAHDFNNILTALLGYAALLKMKLNDGSLSTYVDQILSASQKAADLTRSLLAFSRQQLISLKAVGINSIIEKTDKLLKRLLMEDIAFKIRLAEKDITIMADVTQIDQILFNLVSNARDAMPQGGTLTIETKEVVLDSHFKHLHGYGEPGKYALLAVSDTGSGMDGATLKKIFDPFFTTKEVGRGTGLGLATVYGIVKQHNGYIVAYSELGLGTTFHIYLPAFIKADDEEMEVPAPVKGGKETILIAEDNQSVRNLTKEILSEYGYNIIETADGLDAVEQFRKADKIDLLILDTVMPKKNGREAYDEIIRIKADVKVLFMSGYTRDVVLDKGIEGEKFDFISKPATPEALLRKVREVLDK